MATVSELIERIEYLVDDDITPRVCVMLINMALEDLSEVAGYMRIVETDFLKGASYVTIPSDYIDMEEVRVKRKTDTEYKQVLLDAFFHKYEDLTDEDMFFFGELKKDDIHRYRLEDNLMTLLPNAPYDGNIQLKYYAMLPGITENDLNAIPRLRLQFHRGIPLYAAAKYQQNWKDSLSEKNDFWGEYIEVKTALYQDTAERKQKARSQYVVKTRGWK